MSLYDRDYIREENQHTAFPRPKTVVGSLIVVNVAIFLVDNLILATGSLSSQMVVYGETIIRPLEWWRFVTSGFAHASGSPHHLFGNMIGLFFFGRPLEQAYGSKRFLKFYLTAIVLGSIGFSARNYLMGNPGVPMLGASGAVFAIVIVYALKYPHNKVYLLFLPVPISAWVLAAGYMLMTVMSLNSSDHIAHDVHLIGALYGFLFFKTGWDCTQLLPTALSGMFSRGRTTMPGMPKRRPKVKLYDPDAKSQKLDQEADRLLEKVHRDGASSLSAKERKTLEEYSRRMQQKRR